MPQHTHKHYSIYTIYYILLLYITIHTSRIAALALELSGRVVERHARVGTGRLITSKEGCAHMVYYAMYIITKTIENSVEG